MTRADWQQIAEERLLAAQALLAAAQWSSAFYLAGYAVECGLKSCVVARIAKTPEVVFQEGGNKFSADCWTHDIPKLVKLADLEGNRKADIAANSILANYWGIASQWNEKSRYQTKTRAEAEGLYDAIADNANGVMKWIRIHW